MFKRSAVLLVLVMGSLLAPGLARAADGVQFTAPAPNASVGGTVTVIATADVGTTSVLFEWSADGSTWRAIGEATIPDPGGGWSEPWDTTQVPEGPVTLRATEKSAGAPGASAEEPVTVDHTAPTVGVAARPAAFSPNGDGRRDRARILVTVDEPSTVEVRVLDPNGDPVATLASGTRVPKGTTTFTWNGKHGSRRVPDGVYSVSVTADDAGGNRGKGSGPLRVDTRAPVVRWVSVTPEPASRAPVTARFTLRDPGGIGHASIGLYGERGLVRTVRVPLPGTGTSSARVPVVDRRGRSLMPGLYRLRLSATDVAGNTRVSNDLAFRIVHPVKATVYGGLDGVGRRVALTFDDCNEQRAWNRIIDILRSNHLLTTFFCIGDNVGRYASTARRAVALGFSISDHTWDHRDLAGHSMAFDENELKKQADAWWKVAHVTPQPYFRPPYGAYDSTTLAAAGRLGFSRVMIWDVDPQDWRRPGASVIASKVLGAIHPGAIVVMHVLSQTADALPSILAGLKRKHLVQSSLPELFAAAGMR